MVGAQTGVKWKCWRDPSVISICTVTGYTISYYYYYYYYFYYYWRDFPVISIHYYFYLDSYHISLVIFTNLYSQSDVFKLGMAMQMREYAVNADYVHIRE